MRVYSIQPTTHLCGNGENGFSRSSAPSVVSFRSIANSSKLRTLFTYGLPGLYRDVIMIDPKRANKLIKSDILDQPVAKSFRYVEEYEPQIKDVEKRVYRILKAYSNEYPDLTIRELMKKIAPSYEEKLAKKQKSLLNKIKAKGENLPAGYKDSFNELMAVTDMKIKREEIIIPFSKQDFIYKLEKIKSDVSNLTNPKSAKVVAKMISEAENMPEGDSRPETELQNETLKFMELILKTSVLKNYEPLRRLLGENKLQINKVKQILPFKRKVFIYALEEVLKDLPDKELKASMLEDARKLPTSRDMAAAFIAKFQDEPSKKIVYRLLLPTYASVEHIHPKSRGGADSMENFGGATVRENSDRGNISFVEQLKRKPKTFKYAQRQINRLVQFARAGIFKKNNIDTAYIRKYAKTLETESNGEIKLKINKNFI